MAIKRITIGKQEIGKAESKMIPDALPIDVEEHIEALRTANAALEAEVSKLTDENEQQEALIQSLQYDIGQLEQALKKT